MLFTTAGGSLSLGPPVGALIFAQAPVIIKSIDRRIKRANMFMFIK
jgi:hypothetical protein